MTNLDVTINGDSGVVPKGAPAERRIKWHVERAEKEVEQQLTLL